VSGISPSDFRLVLTTCANRPEAESIARSLVEGRLAACVNIIEQVQSIYRWQDRIESSSEVLLLIKTSADKLQSAQERICGLHSYTLPEFLVFDISAGSSAYLAWMADGLR
jgi:periplasmic divalent cation tolerance protein